MSDQDPVTDINETIIETPNLAESNSTEEALDKLLGSTKEKEVAAKTKFAVKVYTLTKEQKKIIVDLWNADPKNPPTISDLCAKVFGKKIDLRTAEARAVTKFISDQGAKKSNSGSKYVKDVELTDAQKEFIENNINSIESPLEMARTIFEDESIPTSGPELKATRAYMQTVRKDEDSGRYAFEDYRPPNSVEQAITRANRYIYETIDKTRLTGQQKKDLSKLVAYMNTVKFLMEMNSYEEMKDRDFFESQFIKCVYNKCDLTEEEVDQYITYSSLVVSAYHLNADIIRYTRQVGDITADNADGRVNMALVNHIASLREDLAQNIGQQNAILKTLKGTRSDRLNKKGDLNESFNNLFQLWKEQKTRDEIRKAMNKENEVMARKINEIVNMDDVIVRIFGISEEEILNG